MERRLLLRSLLITAVLVFSVTPTPSAAAAVTMPPGSIALPTSAGDAAVAVEARACDMTCHVANASRVVKLNAGR